jgi:cell division protein YceG involved in septum cleavage
MAKKKKLFGKRGLIYLIICIVILGLGFMFWYQNWQSKFEAPRNNSQSIAFTIGKDFTLDAVVGDLHYYNFIKDENAFRYALVHLKDNNPGRENSLKVGDNTIDREAIYTISQSMTAWQIADILLNQGNYSSCEHGCPESNFLPELLPGGDLAPTIKEKYSWVKTYEDCVKAIGHDGGQLSSEQYAQRTGIRRCIAPDGREFTQGKEGWSDIPSP